MHSCSTAPQPWPGGGARGGVLLHHAAAILGRRIVSMAFPGRCVSRLGCVASSAGKSPSALLTPSRACLLRLLREISDLWDCLALVAQRLGRVEPVPDSVRAASGCGSLQSQDQPGRRSDLLQPAEPVQGGVRQMQERRMRTRDLPCHEVLRPGLPAAFRCSAPAPGWPGVCLGLKTCLFARLMPLGMGSCLRMLFRDVACSMGWRTSAAFL